MYEGNSLSGFHIYHIHFSSSARAAWVPGPVLCSSIGMIVVHNSSLLNCFEMRFVNKPFYQWSLTITKLVCISQVPVGSESLCITHSDLLWEHTVLMCRCLPHAVSLPPPFSSFLSPNFSFLPTWFA